MGEQRDRMLRGELYRVADDPDLDVEARRCFRLVDRYNSTRTDNDDERDRILVDLLGAVGQGTVLRPPVRFDYGIHTRIGARTFANFGLVVLDCAPVTIGDDVQIGPNVQLLTPTHPLEAGPRRAGWEAAHPIAIGDGAWLGGGVIVGPGVTIGADTVVGAGSVVVHDLPAGVLAVGSPARVVRRLDADADADADPGDAAYPGDAAAPAADSGAAAGRRAVSPGGGAAGRARRPPWSRRPRRP
jgi:maltose O-acetyltransferase